MRKTDRAKLSSLDKCPKTVNFDYIVLKKLEERAIKTGSSVSHIVNFICRDIVLTDIKYYQALAKKHYLLFQEYNYMKQQSEVIIETKM